jgi:prolipoprotein diacylglyceryl transferase
MHWHPSPYIFKTEAFSLRWYGVLFALGFALGYSIFKKLAAKEDVNLSKVDSLLFLCIVLSLLTSRLVHVFFYDFGYYSKHPDEILKIWEGGLASHGGGIGLIIAVLIWSKYIYTCNPLKIIDLMTISAMFAGGCIRLGNFMNSEILGKPTDSFLGIVFDLRDPLPRYPAQLIESIVIFAATYVLYLAYKKGALKYPLRMTGLFLVLAFVPRFFIEFIKENQESSSLGFAINMGQILSIPYVIIGSILFYLSNKPFVIKKLQR